MIYRSGKKPYLNFVPPRSHTLLLKLFLSVMLTSFPSCVFGDEIFDKLVIVLQNSAPQMDLIALEKQYQGHNFSGRAYIKNMTRAEDDRLVVYLTTSFKDSPTPVDIAMYIRLSLIKKTARLNIGKSVYFAGKFKEFRMKTIVVEDGLIR